MNLVSNIWNVSFLRGRKTYLSAFLLVVVTGAWKLGYLDNSTYQVVMTVLGALGLASLRSSMP